MSKSRPFQTCSVKLMDPLARELFGDSWQDAMLEGGKLNAP
jgi:hypothetical protein